VVLGLLYSLLAGALVWLRTPQLCNEGSGSEGSS